MFNFEYPKHMPVGRVGLEMSLKPFKQLDDEYIDKVIYELFDQWRDLLRFATSAAVMFWTSDGSEILQYTGDINEEFEWGRYIGLGNPPPGVEPRPLAERKFDRTLHQVPYIYTDDPPKMRWSDVKRIIAAVRRIGGEMYGIPITIVETFDPGPEFAYSDFKFHRHPELNRGSGMSSMWIHCATRLHADNYKYAAYPNGIPEGTHFGRFLGEQFMALVRDVGFDTIWLSNGFGYSLESWNWRGELFDGKAFNHEQAAEIIAAIDEFWQEFTAVTGDMMIECRGSNLSAGMDISAHGTPYDIIYGKYPTIAPPNSPWAALNYRFGLELVGYMSRMAEVPAGGFMFRYYPHDPWWHNSPWFDRYGSIPNDIYLPLVTARLNAEGRTEAPMGINFLTADDSYGRMPRRAPIEIIPHLLNAYSHYPDEAGLVTWLYPFDYYCELGLRAGRMERMFMDDWLIESALVEGLPLNTVISDRSFLKAPKETFDETVLLMPVPEAGSSLEKVLLKAVSDGQKLLLYGNPEYASDRVRALIGVKRCDTGIEGELALTTTLYKDTSRDEMSRTLLHVPLISSGAVTTLAGEAQVTSTVSDGKNERVYSAFNPATNIAWVRGSFPHAASNSSLPENLDPLKYFRVAGLLRGALEHFGITVRFDCETVTTKKPIILNSIKRNGMFITGSADDTFTRAKLNYPDGAPMMVNTEAIVDEEGAEYPLSKWWHNECRLFVRQKERSTVVCRRVTAEHVCVDHRFALRGLKDATVTFRPPKDSRVYISSGSVHYILGEEYPSTVSEDGRRVVVEHVTGSMSFAWQSDDN